MTDSFMRTERFLGSSPCIRCLLLLVVTAVFAILVPPPESSFSSATHELQAYGDASPGLEEKSVGLAAAGKADGLQGETPANLDEKVPGPGVFLGVLLKRLAAASNESDAGIKKLIAGLPQVLPDLNKVLVAL